MGNFDSALVESLNPTRNPSTAEPVDAPGDEGFKLAGGREP